MMIRACLTLSLLALVHITPSRADTQSPRPPTDLQIGALLSAAANSDAMTSGEQEILREMALESDGSLSKTVIDDDQHIVGFDAVDAQHPEMTIPVTGSLSLALGYQFVEAEDRSADLQASGVLEANYQSHDVLVRIAWHLQNQAGF
ncbi:MAG: hypothetical protein ACR2Q4_22035 [Geminicoccaceae bacterium]